MAGGERQVQFNSLERAVSTDFNRLQTFSGYSLSELAKWLFDAFTAEEEAAGFVNTATGTEIPPRAAVVNGLCPYIPAGTGVTTILVSSGLVFINDFDSPLNTDVSLYKYVEDLGVTVASPLNFTPNGTLLPRCDIIECQRNPNVVLESDNRDIFNNVTGLFTAGTVPKVVQDQLIYRIRTGTPGAGFPGAVAEWLPLAVIGVPASATSLDVCDLWDVRPLVSDLARKPFDISESDPLTTKQSLFRASCPALGPYTALEGVYEGILGDRIIGGPMFIDPNSGDYYELGASGFTPGLYHVYQATFFNLPRWARYNKNAVSPQPIRYPYAPRGVTIITQKGCDDFGSPVVPLVAPAITALGALTTTARLAFSGYLAATSGDYVGVVNNDREVALDDQFDLTRAPQLTLLGISGTEITWQATDNVHHPANATHVRVRFEVPLTHQDVTTVSLNSTPANNSLFPFADLVPPITAAWFPFVTNNQWVTSGTPMSSGLNAFSLSFPLQFPAGVTILAISVYYQGASGHSALPSAMPYVRFARIEPPTGGSVIATEVDSSASVADYEAIHTIDIATVTTLDDGYDYQVIVNAEDGTTTKMGAFMWGIKVDVLGLKTLQGSVGLSSWDATATNHVATVLEDGELIIPPGSSPTHVFEAWVPLYPNTSDVPTSRQFKLDYEMEVTIGAAAAYVVGWRTR